MVTYSARSTLGHILMYFVKVHNSLSDVRILAKLVSFTCNWLQFIRLLIEFLPLPASSIRISSLLLCNYLSHDFKRQKYRASSGAQLPTVDSKQNHPSLAAPFCDQAQ